LSYISGVIEGKGTEKGGKRTSQMAH